MRKDCSSIDSSLPGTARHQSAEPDFAEQARDSGIVHSVMGEEVFIFGSEDRVTNNGRDVLVPGDLPPLSGQFNERHLAAVVDVAYGRKLKAGECFYVGQIGPVEINMMYAGCEQSGSAF